MTKIGVLGAGVVGLSVAVQLQKCLPHATICVIADKFGTQTLSNGPGGIFRPVIEKSPGIERSRLMRWVRLSWQHYAELAHSEEAGDAGIQIISGYQYFNNYREDPLYKDVVYCFREMTPEEMNLFPGPKYKYGWFVTTLMVQGAYYIAHLMKRFLMAGGVTERKKIFNFSEFVGDYDVVVNCSGLGSHWLLNDHKLVPQRGQLVKVRAPWLKNFVYTGENTECYILPGSELVSVGGTHQIGDFDTRPRAEDTKTIMERAFKVIPSLKKAKVDHEFVGLRPSRNPLRLETEVMTFPIGNLKVVHNYGHGGDGIGLSWGTSTEAVQLVMSMIEPQQINSKL